MKKYIITVFAFVISLTLTACLGGEKDYKKYIGYSYEGSDPWESTFSINLKELKDDKVTWTFNVVIGEGEGALTLSDEYTNELKDGVIKFDVSGNALEDQTIKYEYSGTITLKDDKLVVLYEKGHLTEESPLGGSASYQVEGLEEDKNEVTLKRVEAK